MYSENVGSSSEQPAYLFIHCTPLVRIRGIDGPDPTKLVLHVAEAVRKTIEPRMAVLELRPTLG